MLNVSFTTSAFYVLQTVGLGGITAEELAEERGINLDLATGVLEHLCDRGELEYSYDDEPVYRPKGLMVCLVAALEGREVWRRPTQSG